MLDLEDFIEERGGNPQKIKESQRRRGASEDLVDEIIVLWQASRTGITCQRFANQTTHKD